jgi:hypothetical protein
LIRITVLAGSGETVVEKMAAYAAVGASDRCPRRALLRMGVRKSRESGIIAA